MAAVSLAVAGRTIEATLNNTPPAQQLLGQLPLTLSFNDFHSQEKLAKLPQPLTMTGVPDSSGAAAGDIGYYAPDQVLVLYYADVAEYPGIVRLGQVAQDDMEFIRSQPDGFQVTLAK